VSSWLHIYQQEPLFSTYREKVARLFMLLNQTIDHLKRAFSEETCLWYDYFDAVGSKLVDRSAPVPKPLSSVLFVIGISPTSRSGSSMSSCTCSFGLSRMANTSHPPKKSPEPWMPDGISAETKPSRWFDDRAAHYQSRTTPARAQP
jgi:hypothetical protein